MVRIGLSMERKSKQHIELAPSLELTLCYQKVDHERPL